MKIPNGVFVCSDPYRAPVAGNPIGPYRDWEATRGIIGSLC